MNIETVITLIATVGGLAGLVTAISTIAFKIYEYKKTAQGETWEAKLDEKLSPILSELKARQVENEELKEGLRKIRLDTTRLQLLELMHGELNIDSTMLVAQHYFEDQGGDWYMSSLFREWAEKNNVEVPFELKH